MKKIMTTLVLAITVIASAFAAEEKVKPEVLAAFNKRFAKASNVSWTVIDNSYKAEFTYHNYKLVARYNTKAELVNVTRSISSFLLPLYLQGRLETKYTDYFVADLTEDSNQKGFNYYIILQKGTEKIHLRSLQGGDWEKYNKE